MIRYLTPLVLCFFGLLIALYSYHTYGDFEHYGAAFFPTIIGGVVALFGLLDLAMEWRIRHRYVFERFNFRQDGKAIFVITVLVLFYLFVSPYLGFIPITTLMLLGLTLPFSRKYRLLLALFLLLLAVLIYGLFAKVLLVPLPVGSLFE